MKWEIIQTLYNILYQTMDKEWRKLIILWIISIAISALALYSFKDVKFKNTKKLAEENARQQAEIQAQIDSYQPEEIPVIDEWLPTTWEFKLVMPAFFSNPWFEQIVVDLAQKDIQLTFNYVMTIEELKWIVRDSFDEYDLYLLPKDRIDGLNLQGIYLWENIKPYFTNVFQDDISSEKNTFIPYSLDPFITITKPWISNVQTWSQIFAYIMLWTQNRAYSFPILWWTTNDDIELVQAWKEPFENYFDILNQQLKLIKDKHSSAELNSMLDTDKVDILNRYSLSSFENLYNLISKNNTNCTDFPWDCIMSYGFTDIKFGFLSDFDIFDRYFTEKDNNFAISSFTNTENAYPVRWWWFIAPNGNKNINLSTEFLKQYLITANEWNIQLWWNTLPAINNVYEEKKLDTKYSNILSREWIFYIIDWNLDAQDNFVWDSKNLDVLRWVYSPDIYVN